MEGQYRNCFSLHTPQLQTDADVLSGVIQGSSAAMGAGTLERKQNLQDLARNLCAFLDVLLALRKLLCAL